VGFTGGTGEIRPGGVSCCMASLERAGMGGRGLKEPVPAGGSPHRRLVQLSLDCLT